jgi:membrane-associated protein
MRAQPNSHPRRGRFRREYVARQVVLRVLSEFGYVAIFGLLVAGGVGMPVPEELIQLTAGYLARREVLELVPAFGATYCGIVTGDFLLFLIAQRHGDRLLARPGVTRLLTPKRRAALEGHFARHAFLTIVVARHMSGFRVPAYILAATHQVRALTFLLADALSAMLSVPIVVTLGYLFAARLEEMKKRVHEVEIALAIFVALATLAYALWKRRARSVPLEERAQDPEPARRGHP